MSKEIQIGIVSVDNDLHAIAIQNLFEKRYHLKCHIFKIDCISGTSSFNWSNVDELEYQSLLSNSTGDVVNIRELCVIWWRRFSRHQKVSSHVVDERHIDLINNDCEASLLGLLLNTFSGTWISDPTATRLADNKLIQLKAAQIAGFRVPKTLVSQNPQVIREFCRSLSNKVVVKPVRGTSKVPLFTQMLTEEHLASEESLHLCPAMYQEYIPGHRHIRAHCFGDNIYSVLIEAEDLDWRQNLDIPFKPFELNAKSKQCLLQVLRVLNLKMGVFDLKLDFDGNLIWLEVNPQGQFLFSEGLSGLDLTSAFINFIYQEAQQSYHQGCLV
ncbi:hypothetical protein A6769_34305 [Nostoc punctiforme NIES-2108]|uniref:ATP-grasp domain-containing protein n=1 Tax=Nostoc punctiforme NIES-2108 TaxID=1356359 RepID=A0A367R3T0_NOSPU|nr:hypothetical protein A6769_34305 [Nostoc punctiforme NIES-2108]